MTIQFFQQTVSFSNVQESQSGVVKQTISQEFPTDINQGYGTLQGFTLNYKSLDHNFYTGGASITNNQIQGNIITCDCELQLTDKSVNTLDPASVFMEVLFIADCD